MVSDAITGFLIFFLYSVIDLSLLILLPHCFFCNWLLHHLLLLKSPLLMFFIHFCFLRFVFLDSIVFLSFVLDLLLSLSTKCLSKCLKQHKIHQILSIIKILAPSMVAISTFIPQILPLLNLFLNHSMAQGLLIGKDQLCFPYPPKTNFVSLMAPFLNLL